MQCTQLCHSTWKTGNDLVDHNHHGFCHFDAKSILSFCHIGQLTATLWRMESHSGRVVPISHHELDLIAAYSCCMGLLNLWSTSVSWNGAWLVTKPWPWQGHEGAASDNGVEVDLRWPCIPCIPLWYTTIQYDSNNMTDMTEWLYDFFTSSPLTFLHIFTPTVSSPKCVRKCCANSLHGRVLSLESNPASNFMCTNKCRIWGIAATISFATLLSFLVSSGIKFGCHLVLWAWTVKQKEHHKQPSGAKGWPRNEQKTSLSPLSLNCKVVESNRTCRWWFASESTQSTSLPKKSNSCYTGRNWPLITQSFVWLSGFNADHILQ